jgi:drug/metabolite transporter (DMT)-like permease
MTRRRTFWFGALVLANAVWGTTDIAAKIALGSMTPAAVAWTRFSFAMLFFGPVLYRRRRELPRGRELAPFLLLGACGYFINFILNYQGIKFTIASHATALRISEALAIALLSVVVLREQLSKTAVVGLALGVVGVALVLDVDFRSLGLFRSGYRLGDLLVLLSVMVEAGYTVVGKTVLRRTRPLTATALACAAGWLLLTVYSIGEIRSLFVSPPPLSALGACAWLGIVATAVCYSIWYTVLQREESHRVGMTIMVQPMVGIPLAAALMGDRLQWSFLIGAGLIALGVYLVLRTSTESEETAGSAGR